MRWPVASGQTRRVGPCVTIMAMAASTSPPETRLATPIIELPGVAEWHGELFARLGINTVRDLIRHLPSRYEAEEPESNIADLLMGRIGSVRGTVVATRWVRYGKPRFQATLQDHGDQLQAVWFNASYLRDKLYPGMVIRVQGAVKPFGGQPQMTNPQWEALDEVNEVPPKAGRLRPVYPATQGLSSGVIETVISGVLPQVVEQLADPLPEPFVRHRVMPSLAEAYRRVHQPEHVEEAMSARRRLAYNELLLLQLGIAVKRHHSQHELRAPALRWSPAIDQHIRDRFPFELTEDQQQVVQEIAADLQLDRPMNRLLQGDVGAGKTVVALYALLMAVADRKQGGLMAPTELLAEQHYLSITDMLKGSKVRVALLTGQSGSSASPQRRALVEQIGAGEFDIVVGTQALLTESVVFGDLAVVVVDEQHRFGVLQRAAFRSSASATGKAKPAEVSKGTSHYLVMTATPIPRTLSLTVFGDLDVSTIRELPPGRTPITTRHVARDRSKGVYDYLAKRVAGGEQAYVVVPAINDTGHESRAALKNVREHARWLEQKLWPHKVATIHGQLKRQTRESIMYRFRCGQIRVLVATTVIEVGVDVPNATQMVVEHADRFGLAQLHQLRGRIGRNSDGRRSLCVFIADPTTDEAAKRLEAITATTDGFAIAERDLEIRGMGDFFGTRQHGMMPLQIAKIPQDIELLQMARRDVQAIVQQDPQLARRDHELLRKILFREYGESIALVDVG